jgi:tryptophan synthase beta chain
MSQNNVIHTAQTVCITLLILYIMKFSFISTKFDADNRGYFGAFGGRYVPEVLERPLCELTLAYEAAKADPTFVEEVRSLFGNYVGRPTPLYRCKNILEGASGAEIYLKNEGLAHTGAHKINHCVGQILLAKRMGKRKIVAETGAGQHGVATAAVAAKFGFPCTIYMGAIDYDRQRPNVFMMERLGATVVPVHDGTKRLKDAATAAMKHWIAHADDTYFLLGSVIGPHPYPTIVKDFQSVVGLEVQTQLNELTGTSDPDYCIACVGGGSNAIGLFNPYLDHPSVQLIGVEAGGEDVLVPGKHASKITGGARVGFIEGFKSLFLQDDAGQVAPTTSISAGIDYSGIGPQHAYLHAVGRVTYVSVSDEEALAGFAQLARTEGIICALESAHAVAYACKLAPTLPTTARIVVNLSGRGDKDLFITAPHFDADAWSEYLRLQLNNSL